MPAFRPSIGRTLCGVLTGLVLAATGAAQAAPIQPGSDAQVIERLPAAPRTSGSADPVVAVREAQDLLQAARRDSDPRLAGRALARLARWQAQPQAPAEVVLALAEAEQYLHQFVPATQRLQALLQRDPQQAQGWLLLATLHRVQGRYAASDEACVALQRLQVQPWADGCLAENQALRGDFESARPRLQALLARTSEPGTRAWLFTTLAEGAQRAGEPAAAEADWQRALQAAPDTYARIGYADLLLDLQRPQAAWDLLRDAEPGEGVLLRQAIAAHRLGRPEAATLRRTLRERHAQADLRPGDRGHQRERALMALDVEGRTAAALAHARRNVTAQREAVDLWLLARCAQAAGDTAALAEARQLARQMGLRDARIDAL